MQGTFEGTLELNDFKPSGPVFANGVSDSRDKGGLEERTRYSLQPFETASYHLASAI